MKSTLSLLTHGTAFLKSYNGTNKIVTKTYFSIMLEFDALRNLSRVIPTET